MNMKKLTKVVFATIVVTLGVVGCGSTIEEKSAVEAEAVVTEQETVYVTETATATTDKEEEEITAAVTFTDDLGREVTVENPQRVATMIGSFTDIWLLAGGEVVAAAKDSWTSFDLGLSEDVVNFGSHVEPDVEQLLAAKPDFVIASANTDADIELEEILTQAGITVAYFAVSDFEEYLHMLDICTKITGREELYQQYGLDVKAQIEAVKERVDGSAPTVLFLRASSSSVKAKGSEGSVGGEILADLGCVNIADSDESLLDDLSMEAIITADPAYIFVTTQGTDTDAALKIVEDTLLTNPAWNSLTAVQQGKYYVLDKSLYNLKPNARWGEAYEKLADILYPEQ